jgi:hypothetical protein
MIHLFRWSVGTGDLPPAALPEKDTNSLTVELSPSNANELSSIPSFNIIQYNYFIVEPYPLSQLHQRPSFIVTMKFISVCKVKLVHRRKG